MVASLDALLDGVIDYAGLFPPAKLDMGPAVEEYLDHLEGDEQVLVNRFICPVARLSEFSEALQASGSDVAFELTAIGTGGGDVEAFKKACAEDREAIERFEAGLDGQVTVESIERKIPDAPIDRIAKAAGPLAEFELYFESPFDAGLSDRLHALADLEIAGAKARTGGLDKAAFPAPAVLAGFIKECLDLNVPFKLTAGLHHPFRTNDPATGGVMHGFLNVLVGAALVEAAELSRKELTTILEERNPRAFEFDAEGLAWRSQRASIEAIDSMRTLLVGFGSCSVKEPVDDLLRLGLW